MLTKVCNRCKEEKTLDLFDKGHENVLGRVPYCKACRSVESSKKYRQNWFTYQHRLKKAEAKKKGLPFDLTADYMKSIWTDTCPVFGVLFVMFDKRRSDGPTLDRMDPKKGYVKGNVHYICHRANRIKYDATVDELKAIIDYMEGATTIPEGSTLK